MSADSTVYVWNDLDAQRAQSEIALNELKAKHLELEIAAGERMAAKVKATFEHSGQFQLIGEIHEASVHNLITHIESFASRNPGAGVTLLINSGGGHVLDGLALVDYLKLLSKRGHKVTIVGYGLVASMAGVLLQAADDRVLTSRCYLGLHEVSSGVQGTVTVQEDTIKFTKRLQAEAVALLCAKSNLTPAKLKTLWARKDVYCSAAEALKYGLIDRIEETE